MGLSWTMRMSVLCPAVSVSLVVVDALCCAWQGTGPCTWTRRRSPAPAATHSARMTR
jgi:hypothetical protein